MYVYGQISTSEGAEFEIATMNSARRFVLWTRIDQAAFEDGGGYGEEEADADVTDRAQLLEMEGLVKRGIRDTKTLVTVTITVHFTRKFRYVMLNSKLRQIDVVGTMSECTPINGMFLTLFRILLIFCSSFWQSVCAKNPDHLYSLKSLKDHCQPYKDAKIIKAKFLVLSCGPI